MAEEGTVAVLDAETEVEPVEAEAETVIEEEVSETEPQSFTEEEVQERERLAVEKVREEAREQAQAAAEAARAAQVTQQWQRLGGTLGLDTMRKVATWGAKLASSGTDPDEVGGKLQGVHIQEFLKTASDTLMPYVAAEHIKSLTDYGVKKLETAFPDWKPSRETETKFRNAMLTQDGAKMAEGLFDYIRSAYEESELPKRAKALKEADAKKTRSAREVEAMQKVATDGPTRGVPSAVGPSNPDQVLETAHPLSKEYAAAFKLKHGFDAPKP